MEPMSRNENDVQEPKKKRVEWQRKEDLGRYVKLLAAKYKTHLSHIQSDNILYAAFSKDKSSKLAEIKPIKGCWSLFRNECYIITVHLEGWESLPDPERYYTLYNQLLHIPEYGFIDGEKEYRKLLKPDLFDFKCLVDEFGVYKENITRLWMMMN